MSDATSHPEARTMAAFVDGKLAPEEIATVAAHLRGCSDCRTMVTETARFAREEAPLSQPIVFRKRVPWLAAAAVAAGIAVALPLIFHSIDAKREPMARLIAAAPREHRLVAARLSGFPWARFAAPTRGKSRPDAADLKLAGAVGEVLEQTARRDEAESRHSTGVAYLLIGRRDESVAALEQAARGSNDARPWSDLAAARYAVAVDEQRPSELPQALADIDHALRLDARNPAALFNRALIVEQLGAHAQALAAWQKYLDVDSASEWSVEARQHLRALQTTSRRFDPKLLQQSDAAALVREFPQQVRTWSEGVLLPEWGDAEIAHDAAHATDTLNRVRRFGDALAQSAGEQLLHDAVAAIDHANVANRATLAAAHRAYRAARIDYSKRQPAVAETQFRRVAESFARSGSPMSQVASYYAASAAFDQNRGDEAHDELAQILATIDAGRYRALAAQVHWALADCANNTGDWGTGAREADASATLFRLLGEREHTAFLGGIAAVALELIGENDLAWQYRIESLAQLSDAGADAEAATLLHSAGTTLAAMDELMFDARDAAQHAFASADAARFAARSGDVARARTSLASARSSAAMVSDDALRESVSRQVDLADAAVRGESDARAAIGALDRSIAFFIARQQNVDLAEAYLQRAKDHRALGDEVVALADLSNAMREVEKQRATIGSMESKLRFVDVAAQILAGTIDLRLKRGESEEAFAIADRARSVTAAGALTRTNSRDVAVIEFAVLPKSIAAFSVTSSGVTATRIDIDAGNLASRVAAFVELIRGRAPIAEIHATGAALHRLLLAPLHVDGANELVIVADRQLYALPFAALWNEERKQYLGEQFTIRFALSANASPETPEPLAPALIVADPPTPLWQALPGSREEAARIAAIHIGATLLTGDAATRSAFAEAARGSALIHFAGHANSDASGTYAALLLAARGEDSGVVGANDIARLRLDRHPLVVLAACGTFRGNAQHVAGMSSLARAFLTAGARGVVGTLWEIDDDVSSPLFLRFHEQLRAGASPSRALREAQLQLIHSANPRLAHPATWAPAESLSNEIR